MNVLGKQFSAYTAPSTCNRCHYFALIIGRIELPSENRTVYSRELLVIFATFDKEVVPPPPRMPFLLRCADDILRVVAFADIDFGVDPAEGSVDLPRMG